MSKKHASSGYLIDIQQFSVNDGEGIRTTIFFAGCPLRCQWCSNPESQSMDPEIYFYENTCIGCGLCVKVCPLHIGINLNTPEARKRCIKCGRCVEVCPTKSRRFSKKLYTADELETLIEKKRIFLQYSQGGITYSGGEATQQAPFLRTLVERFHALGYNQAIESCGFFKFEEIKDILQKLNLIFIDLKHMDSKTHLHFTGQDNQCILENIKKVATLNIPLVIRIPVVVNVNASEKNILATGQWIKANVPQAKLELLPYHTYGEAKYRAMGKKLPSADFATPTENWINDLEYKLKQIDIQIVHYQ